jgi:tight adherence protein B
MLGLIALLTFLTLLLMGYALAGWAREREATRGALAQRLESVTGVGVDTPSLLKDQRLSTIGALNSVLARVSPAQKAVKMVQQARIKRRVGEVLLYIPLLALIGFLLVNLITGSRLLAAAAAVIAGSIPLLVVERIRRQRARLFGEQLPDALDLIRAALQAGHGFLGALQVVAQEFPDPIAEELRDVTEEVRLGLPLRDALYHLVDRVDDPNIPILVVGVLIVQEVGGNLAEVIDNIAYTIRERFKLQREILVMTAQGRLSGLVLTALPLLVGLFLYFLNPQYFAPMIGTSSGHWMLGYAAVSILCGHFVIRRIVNLRV